MIFVRWFSFIGFQYLIFDLELLKSVELYWDGVIDQPCCLNISDTHQSQIVRDQCSTNISDPDAVPASDTYPATSPTAHTTSPNHDGHRLFYLCLSLFTRRRISIIKLIIEDNLLHLFFYYATTSSYQNSHPSLTCLIIGF